MINSSILTIFVKGPIEDGSQGPKYISKSKMTYKTVFYVDLEQRLHLLRHKTIEEKAMIV